MSLALVEPRGECGHPEGLLKNLTSELLGFLQFLVRISPGQQRKMLPLAPVPVLILNKCETVHGRHVQIRDDDVSTHVTFGTWAGVVEKERTESRLGKLVNLISSFLQNGREDAANPVIIIKNKGPDLHKNTPPAAPSLVD